MPKSMKMFSNVYVSPQPTLERLLASSCNAMSMDRCLKYTSENAVSQFCELDTSHTAVYSIFIIHTGFKACGGIQGIYANEDWRLLWSPRISSVNSLYGMIHYALVMMSLSEQCAWLGGFFVYIFFYL